MKKPGKIVAKYDHGAQIRGGEWLHLHRNENLFVDREWTVETARRLVEQAAIETFPDPVCGELRDELGRLYGVAPENIFVGNGSDEVLCDLFHLFRESYDTVHVLDVCFKIYLLLAERFGYAPRPLEGRTFETGRVDARDFHGLAVIDSPNSITGAPIASADLRRLSLNDDAMLVWDNAYGEYAGDQPPSDRRPNEVFVRSFSKFYAIAGLRVGYCIADRGIVDALMARKDAFNVNSFAQVMAVESLRQRERFEEFSRRMLDCRREMVDRLCELDFDVHASEACFVLATHRRMAGAALQQELAKRQVAVRRFDGPLTGNSIRLAVPPMPGVERLVDTLREILAAAPQRSAAR